MIRTFISLPAGVVRMPFWRFTLYTVLGVPTVDVRARLVGIRLGRNDGDGRARAPAVLMGDRRTCAITLVWYVRRRWTKTLRELRIARRCRDRRAGRAGAVTASRRGARGARHRLTSIVQFSPCSPTRSNPTRWYIMRERLWTATDSDIVWNPSSRACTVAARSKVPPMPFRRCSGWTATDSSASSRRRNRSRARPR